MTSKQPKKETTGSFFGKLFRAGVRRVKIPEGLDPDLKEIAQDVQNGILGPDPNSMQVEGEEIEEEETKETHPQQGVA